MSVETEQKQKWITLGKAAEILGVSLRTMRNKVAAGEFSTLDTCMWTKVPLAEVEAARRKGTRLVTAAGRE